MGTKLTKSVGNLSSVSVEYLEKAAKMCPYPVNIPERYISVPQDELVQAADSLAVSHLVNSHGFHIQSCIPGSIERVQVFNPTIHMQSRAKQRSEFETGDCFRVKSTACELSIVRVEKKIQLAYTNRTGKHDLIVSEEQLKKALSFETWERI